jgi:hypothetical protein
MNTFLIKNDGWDKQQLADTGLTDLLEEFAAMQYELTGCRRGSYAISGDTAQDLVDDLYEMRDKLASIINEIENGIHNEPNSPGVL